MYHALCVQRAAFHSFDTLSVPLLHLMPMDSMV